LLPRDSKSTIHSFSLRCAYPIASFAREEDGEPFLKSCALHSSVIPSESYTELNTEAERLRNISHGPAQTRLVITPFGNPPA
jgi:hypothetical protein